MSGQGNLMDFEVSGAIDDSMGAVIIAGIPLTSNNVTSGEVIQYEDSIQQLDYKLQPPSNVFLARSTVEQTPVAGTDLLFPTDVSVIGSAYTRLNDSTVTCQPGVFRLTFQAKTGEFAATGATESVTYQFYNQTTSTAFGPIGSVSGFAPATTVVCGVDIEVTVRFTTATDVSLRVLTVSGTQPQIFGARLSIYKIE